MPACLIGLGRVVWYGVLAPLSLAHCLLCVIGGSQRHEKLLIDCGPLILPWLGMCLIWTAGLLRFLGHFDTP